jgi:hypothetical protein
MVSDLKMLLSPSPAGAVAEDGDRSVFMLCGERSFMMSDF